MTNPFNPFLVSIIKIENWFPKEIEAILTFFFNKIYSNIIPILFIIFLVGCIIILIYEKTPIFNILPEPTDYSDGKTLSWNPYSASRRLSGFCGQLVTSIWIYFFLFQVLFNKANFISNFQKNISYTKLIIPNILTNEKLAISTFLFYLNLLILVWHILRSLFILEYPTKKISIESNHIRNYIKLNFFFEKNYNGEKFETMLLKREFSKKTFFILQLFS